MHSDDAGGAAFVMQPGRGERALPVVEVHDVRPPVERRSGLAEQGGIATAGARFITAMSCAAVVAPPRLTTEKVSANGSYFAAHRTRDRA